MRNKYRAIKSNGYDSRKENKRAGELALRERAKEITMLQEQVKFKLTPSFKDNQGNTERAIAYIADFVYLENGKWICEDTKSTRGKPTFKMVNGVLKKKKGFSTADNPVFIMKRKLFKLNYPEYIFRET